MPKFRVTMLPCKRQYTTNAVTVFDAVAKAHAPMNAAIVDRLDYQDSDVYKAAIGTCVTFPDRPCATHFVGFRDSQQWASAV